LDIAVLDELSNIYCTIIKVSLTEQLIEVIVRSHTSTWLWNRLCWYFENVKELNFEPDMSELDEDRPGIYFGCISCQSRCSFI